MARALIELAGLRGLRATAAHFAALWGSSLAMLPALEVVPPPWRQEPAELGIDALHHIVYATATGAAWAALV